MFDTLGDGDLIDVISSSQRAEAQAASRRLSAIGVLVDRHADPDRQDPRDRFAVDRWDEVAAQVAAAQGITHALASHQMRYAYVLRHRLRAVAQRFAAGDIDFRTVALIIGRTELLDDDAVVAAVDAAIVEAMPRWERWSIKRLTTALDALVCRHDPDAVRRTKTATDDRHIEIRPLDTGDPLAEIWGVLQTPYAVALDKRLNQLVDMSKAETVDAVVTSFVAHPDTVLTLAKVKKQTRSNEPLLGYDATQPTQRQVLGVPPILSAAVATGDVWAIPAAKVVVVPRDDVRLDVDRSRYFESDRIGIKATMRVGFAFPHPAAIVRLYKPKASAVWPSCPLLKCRGEARPSLCGDAAATPPARAPGACASFRNLAPRGAAHPAEWVGG